MRKATDGKTWDGKTVKLIRRWNNGHSITDPRYCAETLYQTEEGNFFLSGEGGPLTHYRRARGDSWTSGNEIRPLTPAEAITWFGAHGGEVVLYYVVDRSVHEDVMKSVQASLTAHFTPHYFRHLHKKLNKVSLMQTDNAEKGN